MTESRYSSRLTYVVERTVLTEEMPCTPPLYAKAVLVPFRKDLSKVPYPPTIAPSSIKILTLL